MNNNWLKIIINSDKKSHEKNHLDSEIVPITSDTPSINTVSEHLDISEYYNI